MIETEFTIGTTLAIYRSDPVELDQGFMKVEQPASAIEARLVVPSGPGNPICSASTAERQLATSSQTLCPGTLLITSLANGQLIRVAELMDVPGIRLSDGKEPDAGVVALAREAGAALLVSRASRENLCARAAQCLAAEKVPGNDHAELSNCRRGTSIKPALRRGSSRSSFRSWAWMPPSCDAQ